MRALPDHLGPGRPSWHAPVNPFQEHREHSWGQRNNTTRRLRPHKATLLQPLCHENQALAVPDQNLQQVTSTSTKAEYRAAVRILREHGLHLRGQAVESLAHIGRAASKVDARTRRWAEHQRPPSSASTMRSVTASTAPVTRMLAPLGSTISRLPAASTAAGTAGGAGKAGGGGSCTTATGANPAIAVASICLRQV